METYLVAKFNLNNYPFIKIKDDQESDGQRVIRISFIGTHHHYSIHEARILSENQNNYLINLHKQKTKLNKFYTKGIPLIFTSYDDDKPSSTWDEEIANSAKRLNNPFKHTKYYENRVLPLGNIDPYPLGGRRIYLNKSKEYQEEKCIFYKVNKEAFFIETDFTRIGFKIKPTIEVKSSVGNLGFYFDRI